MFNDLQSGMSEIGTVLVLEDEMLVAVVIEDCLRDLGATDVVVCMTTGEAAHLVDKRQVDCAVLDVRVGGVDSFAVADRLADLGIPFIFASASMPEEFPQRHRERTQLSKPFSNEQLVQSLLATLATVPEKA